MSLTQVGPLEYFAALQLLESELLRFRVRASEARLDVVVNYAADTLGAYASHLKSGGRPDGYRVESVDFRLLEFLGVKSVRTRLGPNVPADRSPKGDSDHAWAAHEKVLLSMRHLITNVECNNSGNGFECLMYFNSFGEHRWEFTHLFVDRRVANVLRRKDGKTEYRDVSTGRVIDPADPFCEEMMLPSSHWHVS